MLELFPFFIIILAGLVFSSILGRFRIPWVITLIIAGFVIGPFGFNLFEVDVTIEFFAHMGLIFLMFLTGLEVKLSTFQERKKQIGKIALLNGGLPFLTGLFLLLFWGYGFIPALLFGIVFISSSVAIIVPSLYEHKLIGSSIGNAIMAAVVFQDVLSLFLLSFLIQFASPDLNLLFILLYLVLLIVLLFIKWLIPKIHNLIFYISKKDTFEKELRLILVILLGIVVFFELIGLHAIVAAFLAGLLLSDFIKSPGLKEKLHVMGYGIFIPIFFIVVGMNTNLGVFKDVTNIGFLLVLVILGSMLSKFIGGFLGSRLAGFNAKQGLLTGSATIPQLSTTLAAVFAGFEVGLIDQELVAIMVLLSIITTFVGPVLMKIIMAKTKNIYL